MRRSEGSDGSFIVSRIDFLFFLLSWNVLTLCIHVVFFASWPTLLCGKEKFTSQQHKQLSPTFISRQSSTSKKFSFQDLTRSFPLSETRRQHDDVWKLNKRRRANESFSLPLLVPLPHIVFWGLLFFNLLSSFLLDVLFCSIVETEKFFFFSKQEREHKKFHSSVMSRISLKTFWDILDLSAEAFAKLFVSLVSSFVNFVGNVIYSWLSFYVFPEFYMSLEDE